MIYRGYEAVIGLEVHVELDTASKVFCACSTRFGAEPNTQICPVCTGQPGALPTVNRRAVELTVKAGLATHCTVAERSSFDRKNYFYPDLPKGYQITQFRQPLCRGGYLDISVDGVEKRIGITRIHLEEDAGKLIHEGNESLLDLNRCGVPLAEIVTEPDLRSAAEAKEYLQKLRTVLRFVGVSECRMQEGGLRCDVNLSVRPVGADWLSTRTEMKNLNSFRFVARAIEHEFRRQVDLVLEGGEVVQETRRYDPDTDKTYPMRGKQETADYRYFPEPDLPDLLIAEGQVQALAATLPELPDSRACRYVTAFEISPADAALLSSDRALAEFFEGAANASRYPRNVVNLLTSVGLAQLPSEGFATPASPAHLAELADALGDGVINSSTAKKLAERLFAADLSPSEVIAREGLAQLTDAALLTALVREAIAENPRALAAYRAGKQAAAATIVGAVMAKTKGRAEPRLLSDIVTRLLEE
ncbi:MAG: Asp-tRNA(Asn)/Glu-tRNA(Gln) amidotransferase subunit GatB [Clostridia bacterium]|nr:Asp-tRNA(Asn)/Glu-tRNA(Gln) amidotransferase subunit GatB [Clostridia bacterium]